MSEVPQLRHLLEYDLQEALGQLFFNWGFCEIIKPYPQLSIN